MKGRSLFIAAAFALMLGNVAVSAHDVTTEQIITVFVQAEGNQVIFLLRVPMSVLADANLPKLASGQLDTGAIDGPLRLVAADISNNLAVRQGGIILSQPTATVLVSPASDTSFAAFPTALAHVRTARMPVDQPIVTAQAFADFELRYPAQQGGNQGLSARLNTFRAQRQRIRTVAHYVLPSGDTRTFRVAGPPERIVFDPDRTEVFREFVSRGQRGLLGGGDHLLFLLCLAVPVRRAAAAAVARLFAAVAIGQASVVLAFALGFSMTPDALLVIAMIAASAVVIAALQNIAGADRRWVWLLALGFGVLNGCTFGGSMADARPFAGTHVALAVMVFLLVIELGQFCVTAQLWATRTWLEECGLPVRIPAIVLSALVAHAGVNRVVERQDALSPVGAGVLDSALVLLVLGWVCVILLPGVIEMLTGRRVFQRDRAALSSTVEGQ